MKLLPLCLPLAIFVAIPATAQKPDRTEVALPATPLELRIEQVPAMLSGKLKYEDYFGPSFLAAVPADQIKTLSAQLVSQYGQPVKIQSIDQKSPSMATVKVEFERAVASLDISVEAAAPNRVVGLLINGVEMKGDSFAKIDADFASLPGKVGYLVEKLDPSGHHKQIAGRASNQQFAVGSTFKLYVLAELASQVQEGRRSWSDVVPIGENSFSSMGTQNWPRSTPVTLQTLAIWMISLSDNAATDALIRVLGRDAVEEKLATIGHGDPDKALPLLTTVEAFALKSNPALRAEFQKASEVQQRAILNDRANELRFENVNMAALGSGPVAIDSIEWFASPADVALLLNNIRRTASPAALEVMAVNKGVGPASAAKWQYLGYKGGSEPGVISMSFLAQSKAGEWYAISGSWNNSAKEVDNNAFAILMARLLDSVAG